MTSITQTPKITRIDLKDFPNVAGIQVKKWADGWTANSMPAEISTQTKMTLEEMVEWMRENGWDVVTWEADEFMGIPAGARGFKGPRKPIRTRDQMKRERARLQKQSEEWYDTYYRGKQDTYTPIPYVCGMVHAIDLAYEL